MSSFGLSGTPPCNTRIIPGEVSHAFPNKGFGGRFRSTSKTGSRTAAGATSHHNGSPGVSRVKSVQTRSRSSPASSCRPNSSAGTGNSTSVPRVT